MFQSINTCTPPFWQFVRALHIVLRCPAGRLSRAFNYCPTLRHRSILYLLRSLGVERALIVEHVIHMAFEWSVKNTTCRNDRPRRAAFKQGSNLRFLLNSLCHFPSPSGHGGSRSRCVKLTDTLTTLPVCKFLYPPPPPAITHTAFDVHSTCVLTSSP